MILSEILQPLLENLEEIEAPDNLVAALLAGRHVTINLGYTDMTMTIILKPNDEMVETSLEIH